MGEGGDEPIGLNYGSNTKMPYYFRVLVCSFTKYLCELSVTTHHTKWLGTTLSIHLLVLKGQ